MISAESKGSNSALAAWACFSIHSGFQRRYTEVLMASSIFDPAVSISSVEALLQQMGASLLSFSPTLVTKAHHGKDGKWFRHRSIMEANDASTFPLTISSEHSGCFVMSRQKQFFLKVVNLSFHQVGKIWSNKALVKTLDSSLGEI